MNEENIKNKTHIDLSDEVMHPCEDITKQEYEKLITELQQLLYFKDKLDSKTLD